MSRVFITGSTDGLGLAAARTLMAEGHEVVLHARSKERASSLSAIEHRSAGIVIGDLSSAAETRSVAEQVNRIGRMDAVIHNAGIYLERSRGDTREGHARTRPDQAARPSRVPQQRHAPERKRLVASTGKRVTGAPVRPIRRPSFTSRHSPRRSHATSPKSSATQSIRDGSPPRWAEPARPTTWKNGT
jgi:NAD(P)-dependent dehydrogenase (short-subunit alcohol dehydrogenase family)